MTEAETPLSNWLRSKPKDSKQGEPAKQPARADEVSSGKYGNVPGLIATSMQAWKFTETNQDSIYISFGFSRNIGAILFKCRFL